MRTTITNIFELAGFAVVKLVHNMAKFRQLVIFTLLSVSVLAGEAQNLWSKQPLGPPAEDVKLGGKVLLVLLLVG